MEQTYLDVQSNERAPAEIPRWAEDGSHTVKDNICYIPSIAYASRRPGIHRPLDFRMA